MCPRDVPMVTQDSGTHGMRRANIGRRWRPIALLCTDQRLRAARPGCFCAARGKGAAMASQLREKPDGATQQRRCFPSKKKAKKMLPRERDTSLCSLRRHRPVFCLLHTTLSVFIRRPGNVSVRKIRFSRDKRSETEGVPSSRLVRWSSIVW
jgi:hypothetical protein